MTSDKSVKVTVIIVTAEGESSDNVCSSVASAVKGVIDGKATVEVHASKPEAPKEEPRGKLSTPALPVPNPEEIVAQQEEALHREERRQNRNAKHVDIAEWLLAKREEYVFSLTSLYRDYYGLTDEAAWNDLAVSSAPTTMPR